MSEKTSYEQWIGLAKWFLCTFTIGIVSLVINWHIQSREVDLKDKEIILKDKEAEFHEMERLAAFVNHALAENVAIRKRFSQYFASVTRSPELRERWKEYAGLVEKEFQETQARKSKLEDLKKELQKASLRGEAVRSELEKVKLELSKTTAELEIKQELIPKMHLGVQLSDKIHTDDLFDYGRWDSPIAFDVLRAFAELSKNVLDPVISNFKNDIHIVKKNSPPKFDVDGSINLTFSVKGVHLNELVCWIKEHTKFDRLERLDLTFSLVPLTRPKSIIETTKTPFQEFIEERLGPNMIILFYRLTDNRQIVEMETNCS